MRRSKQVKLNNRDNSPSFGGISTFRNIYETSESQISDNVKKP